MNRAILPLRLFPVEFSTNSVRLLCMKCLGMPNSTQERGFKGKKKRKHVSRVYRFCVLKLSSARRLLSVDEVQSCVRKHGDYFGRTMFEEITISSGRSNFNHWKFSLRLFDSAIQQQNPFNDSRKLLPTVCLLIFSKHTQSRLSRRSVVMKSYRHEV